MIPNSFATFFTFFNLSIFFSCLSTLSAKVFIFAAVMGAKFVSCSFRMFVSLLTWKEEIDDNLLTWRLMTIYWLEDWWQFIDLKIDDNLLTWRLMTIYWLEDWWQFTGMILGYWKDLCRKLVLYAAGNLQNVCLQISGGLLQVPTHTHNHGVTHRDVDYNPKRIKSPVIRILKTRESFFISKRVGKVVIWSSWEGRCVYQIQLIS